MTMDYTEFYKTCYLRIHAFAQGRVSVGAAGDEVRERTDIPMGRAKLRVHMFMLSGTVVGWRMRAAPNIARGVSAAPVCWIWKNE